MVGVVFSETASTVADAAIDVVGVAAASNCFKCFHGGRPRPRFFTLVAGLVVSSLTASTMVTFFSTMGVTSF